MSSLRWLTHEPASRFGASLLARALRARSIGLPNKRPIGYDWPPIRRRRFPCGHERPRVPYRAMSPHGAQNPRSPSNHLARSGTSAPSRVWDSCLVRAMRTFGNASLTDSGGASPLSSVGSELTSPLACMQVEVTRQDSLIRPSRNPRRARRPYASPCTHCDPPMPSSAPPRLRNSKNNQVPKPRRQYAQGYVEKRIPVAPSRQRCPRAFAHATMRPSEMKTQSPSGSRGRAGVRISNLPP